MLKFTVIINKKSNLTNMRKVKIFIAYSKDDREYKDQLLTHLELLKKEGDVETWDDSQIMIGSQWDQVIKDNLKESDIVLFLVSADSMASKYVQEREIKYAIKRAEEGKVILVPIIIKHCHWRPLKIGNYQALPKNLAPITDIKKWFDLNEAYLHITEELVEIINEVKRKRNQMKYHMESLKSLYESQSINKDNFKGDIEVITGGMFSGKTIQLILRIKKEIFANKKVALFKHIKDNRYSHDYIVSHDKEKMSAIPINDANKIPELSTDADVIGIDEAQFFEDDTIVDVCCLLSNLGKRIIIAGLDMNYRGEPFNYMPKLMAVADKVTKVHAVCINCGNDAHFSYRTVEGNEEIDVGSDDKYDPLCRWCYNKKILYENY